MFFSHQLLARKTPLGQIWMAATLHAKINRRKLDKLNIIKICEEILNPSVPMALRLSGILMGGVVIVYERKVKLLYGKTLGADFIEDDVNRLLVEINEAWKVKAAPDRTVLPKGKSQAKREAVTLPEKVETDFGDVEQLLNFCSATATMGFQQAGYFGMRLEDVDESYINNGPGEDDAFQHCHQADGDNITLFEPFDPYQANGDIHSQYERFDAEGDDETQLNFNSEDHTDIPTTILPSPPHQDEPQIVVENQVQHQEYHKNQQPDECKEDERHDRQRQGLVKNQARRPRAFIMDNEQTLIPGHEYRSWFQNASDIVSRRGRKRKACRDISSAKKIANLMNIPSIILLDEMFKKGIEEISYPATLLELWRKSNRDSPSVRTSAAAPTEPMRTSQADRGNYNDSIGNPFEDFQNGVGSPSSGVPVEKLRRNLVDDTYMGILIEELKASRVVNVFSFSTSEANPMVTPGNSGNEIRSGSASERSNKKRPYSSSKHSGSSLEPVNEENVLHYPDPYFKLSRLSEKDQTPDQEILVETGPTQTQDPVINKSFDKITDTIRMHMKTHFETPGAPQVESLNNLAAGMNRKGAAQLFYQTCVLASHDFLKVEQKVPFGEILISKGSKM